MLRVREFLDRRLSAVDGVRELTDLSEQLAREQPLDETVADLRNEITSSPVGVDDQRRLHQLISDLYHWGWGGSAAGQ